MLSCFLVNPTELTAQTSKEYDSKIALDLSQAAIGNKLSDLNFINQDGQSVKLSDYQGKPLLISLVFTSCHLTCPVTTKQLKLAVTAALDALGDDSFNVVTIGFDTQRDTPENMHVFARQQNINLENWNFLSGTESALNTLTRELGFSYFPSPRGFDHITQISIVDQQGSIYQQVYGEIFELPWLV